MTDKKHWIVKIVPALAFAAGIIMASIGGIMTLSSSAKLALFDHGPYNRITRDQCEYDYNHYGDYLPMEVLVDVPGIRNTKPIVDTRPQKRSDEEIEKCLSEKRIEEKQRFQQDKKQDLVDGLSALIVGLILVLGFRKRK